MEDDIHRRPRADSRSANWELDDPAGNSVLSNSSLGLSNDLNPNFDGFMHSLGDQGEGILTEETVNKITEILTSEQRRALEDSHSFMSGFDSGKIVGLNQQQQEQPCLSGIALAQNVYHEVEHAQYLTLGNASTIRPNHGGRKAASLDSNLTSLSPQKKDIMQRANEDAQAERPEKRNIITAGLQKIKQQLDKTDKVIQPDTGPAVVTEFIGDNGLGFRPELDEISKCSVDSQEGSSMKEMMDSPVRRSSRKTVRLFEITGANIRRKEEEERKDGGEVGQLRSSDDKKEDSSKKKDSSQTGSSTSDKVNKKEELLPTRRSQRSQKTDSEGEDKKEKTNEQKEERGKSKKGGGKSEESEGEDAKKSTRTRRSLKGKSGDEEEKEEKQDVKVVREKHTARKSFDGRRKAPGSFAGNEKRGRKKIEDEVKEEKGSSKAGRKRSAAKTERGKERKVARRGAKKEEKPTEGGDSSSAESVPDDGELSDEDSDFDPDEDPDRPWCICRKPHGNRFMICCDTCEDWFHGDCVGVTQADGKELENRGEEWMCPKCKKKLQALAKEMKEKERQERIKNRLKTEGSSDEGMRKKLLKALEKEWTEEKEPKDPLTLKKEDDDISDDSDDVEDDDGDDLKDEPMEGEEGEKIRIKRERKRERKLQKKRAKISKEEKELREAKKREEELEWKRQLKEMKARAQKAEMAAKRRESGEGQITFEKIGTQKIIRFKDGKEVKREGGSIKHELAERKHSDSKKGLLGKGPEDIRDRRKSDSNVRDVERKRSGEVFRRASHDEPKGKIPKVEKDDGRSPSSKKVRITPTPKTIKAPTTLKFCIVCHKPAMKNSVYCSPECIASYTKESLRLISEDKQKRLGPKSPDVKSPTKESSKATAVNRSISTTDENRQDERITVLERSTKKVIAGVMAPTRANIYKWVEEHPTFEVFRPATQGNNALKEKKDLTEVIRNNVKKSLKETIISRCREVDMDFNSDDLTKLCTTIEEEIVKLYGGTGQKYKTKYRSLIFNLKDPKNRSLYKQVVLGELSPSKLVHMSPEQLASAELAKWREKEAKHTIEMIKKREEEDAYALKHAVKKTHKGEVELENDGEEDMKNLQAHIETAEEQKEVTTEEGGAPVVPVEDTTDQHTKHLFDLNCKICTGKLQPAGERQPILPHVSTSQIHSIPESSVSPTGSPDENDLRQSSPDLIESMNKSPIHIPLPSQEISDPSWSGTVSMQGVSKFETNAYRISGPCDNLSKLIPETLQICGRISHEQVWDYMYQIKSTTHKTIDVLRFEMASEEEKTNYIALYTYFYTRKRIGVIGNCHSGVKDMYVVPIASHDPVPPELKPFDGPGMPDPRPHMLIGIIVRKKETIPQKRSKSSHHTNPEHVSKKSKKKHKEKHKKDDKKRFEDIVFGKQRATAFDEKGSPSETGSYTPSYTPDIMTPPTAATTPVKQNVPPTVKDEKNDELADKLEQQKAELLRLQAEIQAQIQENKALGIPTPVQSLVASSTTSTPISTDLSSTASTQNITTTTTTQPAPSAAPGYYPQAASTSFAPAAGNVPSSAASIMAMVQRVGANILPGQAATESASQLGTPTTPTALKQVQIQGSATTAGIEAVGSSIASSLNIATSTVAVASQPIGITTSLSTPVAMLYQSLIATQTAVTAINTGGSVMSSTAVPLEMAGQPVIGQASVAAVHEALKAAQPGKETAEALTTKTNDIADGDVPYDPADALDLELESKTKEGGAVRSGLAGEGEDEKEGESSVKKENEKSKKSVDGDEPYDPEDDFVLDLIEDISMPAALKKIEKPNLPFPLEMPKKHDNKMPELPPIKLPDKITDRRAASLSSSSTLVDPRSNASPRGAVLPGHVLGSTPTTQSPSARSQSSLTSPSSASSHITSPTSQKTWDPRQQPLTTQPSSDNKQKSEYGASTSASDSITTTDQRQSTDYWQSDRPYDQSYATYTSQQGTGQQTDTRSDSYYQSGAYQGQWPKQDGSYAKGQESYDSSGQRSYDTTGQRSYDSSWQSSDNTQSTDSRTWRSDDQGYSDQTKSKLWQGDYYSRRPYDNQNENNSYGSRPEYSNNQNYTRERDYDQGHHGRSWEGQGDKWEGHSDRWEEQRGYYKEHPRGRGRESHRR